MINSRNLVLLGCDVCDKPIRDASFSDECSVCKMRGHSRCLKSEDHACEKRARDELNVEWVGTLVQFDWEDR